jgi:hypothetical protein
MLPYFKGITTSCILIVTESVTRKQIGVEYCYLESKLMLVITLWLVIYNLSQSSMSGMIIVKSRKIQVFHRYMLFGILRRV